MDNLNKKTIVDLDVYGRTSQSGGALIHEDDFAISNCIIFFLTARKGDYLYKPEVGGVLDTLLFKLLDQTEANFYASQIQKKLDTEFGGLITDIRVSITPNFKNKYYEIKVFYISLQSDESNQVIFYTNTKSEQLYKSIIDIDFIGDNLLAFVSLKLQEIDDKLLFNTSDRKWYWGIYRFNNFNESSINFQEIFDIINNRTEEY